MSQKQKSLLIIVNPKSGGGRALDLLPEIERRLIKLGVTPEIRITDSLKQTREIASMFARGGPGRLAVMGGDGTVNAVASRLLGTESALAVIPAGTGNDFFKLLHIKNNLDEICRVAVSGNIIEMDAGVINDQPFFNMMGVGFDAQVAVEANRIPKNSGIFTYLAALYKVWRIFPTYDLKLRIDRLEITKKVMLVAIGIGRSTGGGFLLTPQAIANDGKFDLCIISKTRRWRVLSILPHVLNGTHIRLTESSMYRCRQIEITSDSPLPVHYEGETFANNNGRLLIKMSNRKLKVVAGD